MKRKAKARIDAICQRAVTGFTIDIFDIEKIYREAERLTALGASDVETYEGTRAFVANLVASYSDATSCTFETVVAS